MWQHERSMWRMALGALSLAAMATWGGAQQGMAPTHVRKPARTAVEAWHEPHLAGVKFRDGLFVRVLGEELTDGGTGALSGALGVLAGPARGSWERTHRVDGSELQRLRRQASERSGRQLPDLELEFRLRLAPGADAAAAIDALNGLDVVELAWPIARPAEPPTPPDFSGLQGYLAPATGGLGSAKLWPLPGGTGAGIRVCDIEYEYNPLQHDLPQVTLLGPPPAAAGFGPDHATAVLGLLFGESDGAGITGAAHGAEPFFAAAFTSSGWNVAAAITHAATAFGPGDVILLEQQTFGPFGVFVPVEWEFSVYNAVLTAVAAGITVVAAAGNGGQDLDAPIFDQGHSPFLPQNDSGAILVGAGASPGGSTTDRSRLGFSNFGSRLDLQGWGENVTTCGYGQLHNGGPNELYTHLFSGTSSGSALVAAASAQLSAVYRAMTGHPMSTEDLRSVLVGTGSPQQSGIHPASQHIGPRPDLVAALDSLGTLRGCPQPDAFTAAPTPPLAGRRYAAVAYDSARARVVVFGGETSTLGLLDDTWAFDGQSWTQIAAGGPNPRAAATLAYDRKRDRLVLFGGYGGGGQLGDTWEHDGTSWSLRSTSGPGSMSLHSMAYDGARERTVLVGAHSTATAATWEWDGLSWTAFSGGPNGRTRPALAYDSDRERLVLFGGTQPGPLDLDETWERDGTTWTLVATGGPSPRSSAGLVYDTGRRKSVLFGGAQASPFVKFGDLWEWSGSAWQQVTPPALPSARTYHVMAYDETRDRELVLGGDPVFAIATNELFLRSREKQPGVPFCFGDGSGPACPCNNPSGAGACRGCTNSLGVGAGLRSHGVASLSNDSVVLSGTGLSPGFGLFFQGSLAVANGAGLVFGDGLRCAGGGVIRLGVQTSSGGSSSYPFAGQLPVSQKGGVSMPGTRTYQIWYRDTAAMCTGAGFNLTNGLRIAWGL